MTTSTERLRIDQAALIVIDIQGRLADSMCNADSLMTESVRMIRGIRQFELPIFWLEQLPHKLGHTQPAVAEALQGLTPLAKNTFSAWETPAFRAALQASGRRQFLLIGMETHICIWQTAQDLLEQGYSVWVVQDATGSRHADNRALGLNRLTQAGARLTSVEMALFELQKIADGSDRFRTLVQLVR